MSDKSGIGGLKGLMQSVSQVYNGVWDKLGWKPWIRESIETVVGALVLALILRAFVIQAFWIPSTSMVPTLLVDDRVLVNKFIYHFRAPRRGEVIVFEYPRDATKDYVKRLIAVPGDMVYIENGTVFVNGVANEEPYVQNRDNYTLEPFVVPDRSYFVLGDNRPNSEDSRFWGFVPYENIKGPVLIRYWPLNRIGLVD